MKYLILLLVLCALFEQDVLAKKRHKNKNHPKKNHHNHHKHHGGGKIVGGNPVSIKDYNYMAYLFMGFGDDDGFECGGSILNVNTILSAAHCFDDNPSEVTATIGTSKKEEGGTIYDGTFTMHENYDGDTLDYDIAFVTTNTEMELDGVHAQAIALIEEGKSIPSGTMLKISGWGDTSEGGDDSDTLLATEVPSISNEECNNKPNAYVTERQFCGGFEEGGKDHCEGDSGGPAVMADNNVLVGVVSGSFGDCAAPHTPGIYVNLTDPAIRSWIMEHTGV